MVHPGAAPFRPPHSLQPGLTAGGTTFAAIIRARIGEQVVPAARESLARLDAIDGANAKLARAITELAVSWLTPAERGALAAALPALDRLIAEEER